MFELPMILSIIIIALLALVALKLCPIIIYEHSYFDIDHEMIYVTLQVTSCVDTEALSTLESFN